MSTTSSNSHSGSNNSDWGFLFGSGYVGTKRLTANHFVTAYSVVPTPTKPPIPPKCPPGSAKFLGGIEFNTSFSSNTLKEGCMSEFPPAAPSPTCKIPAKCKDQSCIPVECIPADCLAPGVTATTVAPYKTFGNVPVDDLIPPEQALYNVVQGFFMNSLGGAPLNYMQIYAPDIVYAEGACTRKAEVLESFGFSVFPVMVSAEDLLMQANRTLLGIAEPEPGTPPADAPCMVALDVGN
jgi:hypothetical protein